MIAKLQFFKDIASLLSPYLREFQTDKPMLPFVLDALMTSHKRIIKIILCKDVVEDATKLLKIYLENKDSYLPYVHLKFPSATAKALKESGK